MLLHTHCWKDYTEKLFEPAVTPLIQVSNRGHEMLVFISLSVSLAYWWTAQLSLTSSKTVFQNGRGQNSLGLLLKEDGNSDVETVVQCPKALWLHHLPGTSKQEEPKGVQWGSWHVSGIMQNGILVPKELTTDGCVLKLKGGGCWAGKSFNQLTAGDIQLWLNKGEPA